MDNDQDYSDGEPQEDHPLDSDGTEAPKRREFVTPVVSGGASAEGPGGTPTMFQRHAPGQTPPAAETEGAPGDSLSRFISGTTTLLEDVDDKSESVLPRQPRTLIDIGLSKAFLTDLSLKIIHYSGTPSMVQLTRRLGLSSTIVQHLISALTDERLVEVMSQSDLYTGNYRYRLTERGMQRVAEALERTRYAGPVPVTAEQYTEVMRRVQAQRQDVGRGRIKNVLNDLVLSGETTDAVARALFSGKAGIFYGPSGNGKSSILERFAHDLDGFTLVPHAIYAYGQVIRVFDQSIHEPLEEGVSETIARDDSRMDRRWVVIRRPAVVLGAEMGQESLELAHDPQSRFYQVPPHIKAQGGVLLVDDFGRQKIDARDLLTRWLIPLERGWDTLMLTTGEKLTVPFNIQLLLATNLSLRDLADDALLRRILYKVEIPNPQPPEFMEILRNMCRQRQVLVADGALEYAVEKLYNEPGLRPRASYARDLVEMVTESASYDGREPVLNRETFDRVFKMFAAQEGGSSPEADERAPNYY